MQPDVSILCTTRASANAPATTTSPPCKGRKRTISTLSTQQASPEHKKKTKGRKKQDNDDGSDVAIDKAS